MVPRRTVVQWRNAMATSGVYAGDGPGAKPVRSRAWGRRILQSAHPRDVGALALVVGLFLILFIVSVMVGTPTR